MQDVQQDDGPADLRKVQGRALLQQGLLPPSVSGYVGSLLYKCVHPTGGAYKVGLCLRLSGLTELVSPSLFLLQCCRVCCARVQGRAVLQQYPLVLPLSGSPTILESPYWVVGIHSNILNLSLASVFIAEWAVGFWC